MNENYKSKRFIQLEESQNTQNSKVFILSLKFIFFRICVVVVRSNFLFLHSEFYFCLSLRLKLIVLETDDDFFLNFYIFIYSSFDDENKKNRTKT